MGHQKCSLNDRMVRGIRLRVTQTVRAPDIMVAATIAEARGTTNTFEREELSAPSAQRSAHRMHWTMRAGWLPGQPT